MATTIVEGVAPKWHTPIDQLGENVENPTRYKIKGLNPEELDMALEGRTKLSDSSLVLSPSGIKNSIKFGVKGWEHLNDKDGPVPYSPASFIKIPWVHRQELASEIVSISLLSEEDEKN